jgi:transposase
MGRTTVREYLQRAERAGLCWSMAEEMSDTALEERLFSCVTLPPDQVRPLPDWAEVHRQYQRKGVTLLLLWEEYKEHFPEGYAYSRFCDLYRAWAGKQPVWMRQNHKAGERMFVDYAGMTVPVKDRKTGETHDAQIFVAALGASNYTFVEATFSQTLRDWLNSHCRAFSFFGGVTEMVVPDNLRSAINRSCRYDPESNPAYAELARHYNTAIFPARVRKPRDKAKVESAVQGVEYRILAKLRDRNFFSLAELNKAIGVLLEEYNGRPFQKRPESRRMLFEQVDKPVLKPLPQNRYEYAWYHDAKVNLDYHIEADDHYYSVPYRLCGERVQVRQTDTMVEIYHKGQRIASHFRCHRKYQHTTKKEHMPDRHREHAEWTPERIISWVGKSGPAVAEVARRIIALRAIPEQGFRACMGIKRLGDTYGSERLEAACKCAIELKSFSYGSVEDILKKGVAKQETKTSAPAPIHHENLRGSEYYQTNPIQGETPQC